MSCHAVNNAESILSITTDKRELFLYKRSSLESSWNLMLQITSPHPDIYYTSTGCLPLIDSMESASQTSNSVLLFLCGTDHHIYVNELSLTSNSMQPVCVLTVEKSIVFWLIGIWKLDFGNSIPSNVWWEWLYFTLECNCIRTRWQMSYLENWGDWIKELLIIRNAMRTPLQRSQHTIIMYSACPLNLILSRWNL